MTLDRVRRLREFPTSSWAVWNENGTDSISFFEGSLAILKNDVVFVALNRSGTHRDWTNNYQNFHTPGHQGDAALKRLIQGQRLTQLVGAYMTDLCEVFETRSGRVNVDVQASGDILERQLHILGANHTHIICFGNAVFKSLATYYSVSPTSRAGLDCATVEAPRRRSLYKVYHYSMNGFNTKNVKEKLPNQLCAVDAQIKVSRRHRAAP